MKHQIGRKKLNRRSGNREAMIRNQAIQLINVGKLKTTKVRVKAVQQFTEKLVTIARKGNDFNTIRRLNKFLPYDKKAVKKLIDEIAPKYADRPGGYTRVIPMGRRVSDTATIAMLLWV